jgi:hypothetical protein
MAFYSGTKTNQNLVFGNKGEIGNVSFASSEAVTVASTEQKITASEGDAGDRFGGSVAIGSGRIVVGAAEDNSGQGSAYIFDLDGTQLDKIIASDGDAGDLFGTSVAVGNGRIVVGAYNDNSQQGSAYIFDLDGTQLAKITASDGTTNDWFGQSVAIGNGRIVVGVMQDDDNGSNSGSAYIFDLDGTQLAKITASDGTTNDYFGISVAIGNGRIVVGAYVDNSQQGSAYIFDLDGTQLAKITASGGTAFYYFGISVAIGNGRIVVGAYGDDDNGSNSGSAYIFDLDGTELSKITTSDGDASDFFGQSVAIGNGRIVVGALLKNNSRGSAYIYNTNEYYDDYVEKIADNKIGKYTRLTG